MTTTIRFPRPVRSVFGPSEANQILTILPSTNTLLQGGAAMYADISAWKIIAGEEAPYTSIVIEVMASAAATIGDGTTRIGLWGEIDPGGDLSARRRSLLGVLGINLGNDAPQIPIITADTGFAQTTCNVAAYDRLSVGGIEGDIVLGVNVIVTARPIRARVYAG